MDKSKQTPIENEVVSSLFGNCKNVTIGRVTNVYLRVKNPDGTHTDYMSKEEVPAHLRNLFE